MTTSDDGLFVCSNRPTSSPLRHCTINDNCSLDLFTGHLLSLICSLDDFDLLLFLRMSNELGSLSNQKMEDLLQRKRSYEALFSQNTSVTDEPSNNLNQHSVRYPTKGGLQGSNLYLAKVWFNSNQPMTRSRSAELRRRYAEMQNSQSALGMEAIQHISGHNVNNLKQEFAVPNELDNTSICEIPNQFNTFMSPNNSLSSTFNTPQMETEDKVSSVVSMLKGTLERKKLSDQIEKEALDDSCLGYYGAQEIFGNNSLNQEQGNYIREAHGTFQDVSTLQLKDSGVMQMIGGPLHFELEGFLPPTNPIHLSTVSRETSQSESSAAAPILSTCIDGCDGPRSGQIPSICDSSRNQKGRNSESGSRARVDNKQKICPEVKKNKDEAEISETGKIEVKSFTLRDLATATKNFRQECLLGDGGFGRVYKGTLHPSGQVVAVKQLDRNGMQGNKEFLVEVRMLSLLHHPNLLNLIGYCADGDQRLLVYEYMPLGSLEDHLLD